MLSWMVLSSGFVQSAQKGAAKWLKMSGALGCVGLALGFFDLGAGRALAAPLAAAVHQRSDQPAQAMPPSLRQALIAARQNEAGKEFAWQPGAGNKPAQIRHPQGFRVAAQADQLQFGAPGQAVGMHLAALQCAGEKRQVLDVNRPGPTVKNRRAEYALKGGVTEWYENGPMGLEQGFTLSKPCKNPGALTLEIALTGTKSIQQTGTAAEPSLQITPQDPEQKPYNYSNLYAQDAQGKALKAKMSTKGEKILLTVEAAEAKYPIVVDPLVWAEAQKVVAVDGKEYDGFGNSVALSGDTAVIGASSADLVASGSDYGSARRGAGAVYVFVRSGTVWTQQAKLVAADGLANDSFGSRVALEGDTLVVGADGANLAPAPSAASGPERDNAGAAYVFVRNNAAWTQQAKLVADDGKAYDDFGGSVALWGNTVLIGASGADQAGASPFPSPADKHSNSGAAYVFVRNGDAWTQQAKLVAADDQEYDYLGNSVALWGDTAVLGMSFARTNKDRAPEIERLNRGTVYVFVRNGTAWTQQAKLMGTAGESAERFGGSVAISGNTLVAGALSLPTRTTSLTGAAYVFARSGDAWIQQAKLVAADSQENAMFGVSVALVDDALVVGAPFPGPFPSAPKNGAAYVFVRNGDVWTQEAKMVDANTPVQEFLGYSVALSDGTALIGAIGSAYFFNLEGAGGKPKASGCKCDAGSGNNFSLSAWLLPSLLLGLTLLRRPRRA